MAKATYNFQFTVQGTISQKIILNKEYSHYRKVDLERLFCEGALLTTIAHGEDNSDLILIEDNQLRKIGKVVQQDANDDLEISIFEEEDEDF